MISWLTWRIGAFILAGLLAFVGGAGLFDGIQNRAQIRTLNSVIDRTSKDLATASQNLGICQGNYRLIELALDRQNKSIRDLSESSAAATARAERAALDAAKDSKAARESSQRVLALPRPSPDMACQSAARLLRQGVP